MTEPTTVVTDPQPPQDFSLEDALSKLNDRISSASRQIAELFVSLPVCFQCYIERANAERAATEAADAAAALPPLNPVAVFLPVTAVITPEGNLMLAGGGGACKAHIHIGDGPAMPGRTASGLVLPGVGV